MSLLVTGAGGQVGAEICRLAAERGLPFRGLPRRALDITDAAAVRHAASGATIVVNAAAYTAVDKAEQEPDVATAVNRGGAANVASACAALGIPLIHLSTDYVFDGHKASAYLEDDPMQPLSVYGSSKAAGENAVRTALEQHVILRTSWVFATHSRNFVRSILDTAGRNPLLEVVDDQRGGPTPAQEIAQAILVIAATIARPGATPWGTVHFCGAPAVTRYELARAALKNVSGVVLKPVKSADRPTAARRPANSILDCRRIAEHFGIQQPPWEPAVAAIAAASATHSL